MNDKDQIEELSAYLWLETPVPTEEMCDKTAEALHNAGWRKQSEGEWIAKKGYAGYGYYCSNCDTVFTGENAEWIAKEHNYCPNCGAKMKGGNE